MCVMHSVRALFPLPTIFVGPCFTASVRPPNSFLGMDLLTQRRAMKILAAILVGLFACAVPAAAFGFMPLHPVQVCAAVESACSCSRLRSVLQATAHLEMQPSA